MNWIKAIIYAVIAVTIATLGNEKTPATKPTIKRRDGMKLREKARQQFVAHDGIIAAKRHLYLTSHLFNIAINIFNINANRSKSLRIFI